MRSFLVLRPNLFHIGPFRRLIPAYLLTVNIFFRGPCKLRVGKGIPLGYPFGKLIGGTGNPLGYPFGKLIGGKGIPLGNPNREDASALKLGGTFRPAFNIVKIVFVRIFLSIAFGIAGGIASLEAIIFRIELVSTVGGVVSIIFFAAGTVLALTNC